MSARALESDKQPTEVQPAGTVIPVLVGLAGETVLEFVVLAEGADGVAAEDVRTEDVEERTEDVDGRTEDVEGRTEDEARTVDDEETTTDEGAALAEVEGLAVDDTDDGLGAPELSVVRSVSLLGPPQISNATQQPRSAHCKPTTSRLIMLTIARAVVRALVPVDGVSRRAVADLVVAVALIRELDTSQLEALGCAEVRARRAGHVRARRRRTSERTAVRRLGNAANVAPAIRKRSLNGLQADWRIRVGATCGLCASAIPDRVAAGELGDGCVDADVLVYDFGLEDTRISGGLVEHLSKGRAVHDVTVGIDAGVDGLLEEVDVPAVLEVAVVSVASGVAVGQDPGARTPV